MIRVEVGELAAAEAAAVMRPVAADWSAVNPAMRRLELAAGETTARQCQRMGELPVGSAAVTGAGNLPHEFLVHVVVRSTEEPVSAAIIRRALTNGLRQLTAWGIDSVAIPPLGTGAGNFDAEGAAAVMVPVLLEHMAGSAFPARVLIVVESDYEREAFERVLSHDRSVPR